jgi:hypothetical protein
MHFWIPVQARNDENSNIFIFANYDATCILLADKCFSSEESYELSSQL